MILGLTESDAEIEKAAGVNINLWAGLGMLALAAIFLVWAFTRPLGEELAEGRRRAPGDGLTPAGPQPTSAAAGPGSTGSAPARSGTPGANSASTDPPKPPPTIRAPAAPASLHARTAASTSGTLAS